MKQLAISKIPYGETFRVFGDRFVALDLVDGGVLAIRRDIWKNAAFDKDGRNDMRRASIRNDLIDYLIELFGNGADKKSIVKTDIDLKATDGTREYGFFRRKGALLTLEQYGKYQHIIPDAGGWWWLATPWRTPGEKGDCYDYTWYVWPNGYIGFNDCSDSCGIRPALVFAPSLLVEYDDGEEKTDDADREKALYDFYLRYVFDWANFNSENVGESPLSYDEWKRKQENRPAGRGTTPINPAA